MKIKKWVVGERRDSDEILKISKDVGCSYPMALLLYNRGLKTPKNIYDFIHVANESLIDPFLLNDMDVACERILKTVENGEKVCVYGDYDVDGITSTASMYLYLKSIGVDVMYFIPNRLEEGYGVVKDAVKKIAEKGVTLFITVDTGITAVDEVEYAKTLGCDFIVTDHHECHEIIPDAVAVLNPKRKDSTYPFDKLAGVGVAFKLIHGLEIALCGKQKNPDYSEILPKLINDYSDLAALGTIADVMPLVGENRFIVSVGLNRMKKYKRLGLSALLDVFDDKKGSSRDISVSSISYIIAPRLNAAGRMESASKSVDLFMTSTRDEAEKIAGELCEANERRKAEEQAIMNEIESMISNDHSLVEGNVIVLSSEKWHHGVIGIVSSRISEKYMKPCMLISFDGDVGKGSGRSVNGFNLIQALGKCDDLLVKYGGHELAAGISVERDKLDDFRKRLDGLCAECHAIPEIQEVYADFELYPNEIKLSFAEELAVFEPCGTGNPSPVFVINGVRITEVTPIGNGKHTKLKITKDGKNLNALRFGSAPSDIPVTTGDEADIMFTLSVNEYMGMRSEQIIVKEILPSKKYMDLFKSDYDEYTKVKNGEKSPAPSDIPTHDDFAVVYRCLNKVYEGVGIINIRRLMSNTGLSSYTKTRLAVDILCEAGTIAVSEHDGGFIGFESIKPSIKKLSQKVNLEETCLYKALINYQKNTRE